MYALDTRTHTFSFPLHCPFMHYLFRLKCNFYSGLIAHDRKKLNFYGHQRTAFQLEWKETSFFFKFFVTIDESVDVVVIARLCGTATHLLPVDAFRALLLMTDVSNPPLSS